MARSDGPHPTVPKAVEELQLPAADRTDARQSPWPSYHVMIRFPEALSASRRNNA
jgi:hypothetical protein